jgi:predicted metal-binding protein
MAKTKIPTRRILKADEISKETLMKDLERYKEKALEFGASDAAIVPAGSVVVDERVRLKCSQPRCYLYGEEPYCPPHTPEPEFMRKALGKFQWAVLVKNDVYPPEDFTDRGKWFKGHIKHQRKTNEIVSKIESIAYVDGYYFAIGFGAGGCKTTLCEGELCLMMDGGRCRFPLKARSSMEAVGIDVFDIVNKAGWEIYPCHGSDLGHYIPCGVSVGIVFIH